MEMKKLRKTPSFYKGIIYLREKIFPVIHLNELFGLGETESSKKKFILISQINEKVFGLIVDIATDVIDLDPSLIDDTPLKAGLMRENYIKELQIRGTFNCSH
ncbi:chemotaxis protein CheW [Psychrobacillus sp. NPDC096426]|uniref:chemotaxis protein CheW n=1 Tax=Psychrobacillus sp. NPDC096426 TaxID=3364491 RepID=UPI0038161844